uniref:Cytochrome c oxidase subunit 3 n=1 Tax=Scolopendra dehaani TaxID=2609776 RepID=A0A343JML1_SCODE|nr:cytochrome c oxidase subunit 3 [Scolopendra dehaani]
MTNHPYHIVNQSPWPLMSAMSAMMITYGMIMMMHKNNSLMLIMGNMIMLLTALQWWRDISRESTFQGLHTSYVVSGLRWGMVLFITSEILFFISFFWAFFHSSLSPTPEIGLMWPPTSIEPFNPFQIPLLNTAILLSSGVSVTWAHHSLMESNFTKSKQALMITIMLGLYFTILQAYEYKEASFTISDSTFGSTFFMATGFHGIHVIIGTSFLIMCLMRLLLLHFSPKHHFGFEAAAWYWHFVDVVWLFLFTSIYWWGG